MFSSHLGVCVCVAKEEALAKKHYEVLAAKLKKTEEPPRCEMRAIG